MKVLFSSGLLLAALLPSAVLGAHPKDLLSRTQREAGNHPDRVLQTANLTVADLPGPSAICVSTGICTSADCRGAVCLDVLLRGPLILLTGDIGDCRGFDVYAERPERHDGRDR